MSLDLALLLTLPGALVIMGLAGLVEWVRERRKRKRRGLQARSTDFKANRGMRRQ
jgi:hypothetical protein